MRDHEVATGPGLHAGQPMVLTLALVGGRDTLYSVSMRSEVIASVKGSGSTPGAFMRAAGDFGHTLRWLGLQRAYLPDGTDYAGALHFSSASGYDHGQAVASVPEPAQWAMLSLGPVMLGGLVRRPDAR